MNPRYPLLLALAASIGVLGLARGLWGQDKPAPKKLALLVGINDYEHPELRKPEPLKYAVRDVTELAKVLKAAGYQVVLLSDDAQDAKQKPTKENIERELATVVRLCGRGDTLVLALAGHGVQFGPEAYFCPRDARPLATETDTLVSVHLIYQKLEASFAGVKVILVDACRNDPTPGRGRGGIDADGAPPPRGVGVLYSCSRGQRAFEHDSLRHGVFFHHVLEGLKGKAQDSKGRVTFEGLSSYVREEVPGSIERLMPGQRQSPNVKADLEGVPPVLVSMNVPKEAPVIPQPVRVPEGRKAGEEWADNGLKMKFVWCPAGEFKMGSPARDTVAPDDEKPQVAVTLSRGFWLGKYEVTQGEWKQVMGTTPWKVVVFNQSGQEAGAAVSVDGLDVFQFSEVRQADGKPRYSHYIVGARDTTKISGWHYRNEPPDNYASFLVTEYGKGASTKAAHPSQGKIGVITVGICFTFPKGTARSAGSETGFGPPRTAKVTALGRVFDPPHEFISVRYAR